MNDKQRKNLWLGVMAMVMIGIYPPWKEFGAVEKPTGFAPINQPPAMSAGATRLDIDFSRLGIELLLAAAVTAGLVATAGGRPDPPSFMPASNTGNTGNTNNQPNSSKAVKTSRVELPRDYYLGELFVESEDDSEYWEDYCQAKGSLELPKGKKIQLELAKDIRVDLSFLSAFPSDAIYSVDASDAKISDDDLSKLGGLASIRELDLSGTAVGSNGVVNLKSLAKLEKLWLDRTAIDEQCVPALISLSKLKKLSITGTNLNELALESLKKDLPNCELIVS
ncbi:MAG: hypothetical protein WCT03_20580 [Candidatus Obscuribacterales bacterium]|jgi:hypothetical protein